MALPEPRYRRVLLKLSGEALVGDVGFGIDPKVLDRIAAEVSEVTAAAVQVCLVVGGGNLFRGAELHAAGLDRVTGDHMGMLATVMNALAMGCALERAGVPSRVMSAIPMSGVVERYDHRRALRHLAAGEVLLFSAGTGNPFFTTDTAACLRGIEVGADIVLKATKVDGVYSADPVTRPDAVKYHQLGYDEVLERQLGVMDLTAVCLARDHGMPVMVFDMNRRGVLVDIMAGKPVGTRIG